MYNPCYCIHRIKYSLVLFVKCLSDGWFYNIDMYNKKTDQYTTVWCFNICHTFITRYFIFIRSGHLRKCNNHIYIYVFVYQLTVQILELVVCWLMLFFFTVDSTRLYLITFEKGRSNFINAVQVPVCKLVVACPYQFYKLCIFIYLVYVCFWILIIYIYVLIYTFLYIYIYMLTVLLLEISSSSCM